MDWQRNNWMSQREYIDKGISLHGMTKWPQNPYLSDEQLMKEWKKRRSNLRESTSLLWHLFKTHSSREGKDGTFDLKYGYKPSTSWTV